MDANLKNTIGDRGEAIVELRLTDYKDFTRPLFKPSFLGDKWPSIDFFVELRNVGGTTPYFFAQAKATRANLKRDAKNLVISTNAKDIKKLLSRPGPTYLFGIHEPTERVFIRSVHRGLVTRAITRIPLSHELNSVNLRSLHTEVKRFWQGIECKPEESIFA